MSKDCPICFEEIKVLESKKTKCNHEFHSACLTRWLSSKNTCPMCRSVLESSDFKSMYFRDYIPYEYPIYPADYVPSGSVHVSRINNIYIVNADGTTSLYDPEHVHQATSA
jgi:hypothetical protein